MTVNEVIALAKSGELLQLSPTIKNDNETLVGFINLGMIELYKRFVLKTEEAIITLVDGKTIYSLDGTDPDVDIPAGNFMYIINAYEEVEESTGYTTSVSVPINEEDSLYSINTISYNQIQVPLISNGAYLSIIYAAKPVKATTAGLDTELPIPEQLVESLLHYIGYRGHGSMDGEIQTESNSHYMRFEASCNKARELGVGITADDMSMASRVATRGFV